jgi:hypothetical protein
MYRLGQSSFFVPAEVVEPEFMPLWSGKEESGRNHRPENVTFRNLHLSGGGGMQLRRRLTSILANFLIISLAWVNYHANRYKLTWQMH